MFELLHFLKLEGMSLTPLFSLPFPSSFNLNTFKYRRVSVQRTPAFWPDGSRTSFFAKAPAGNHARGISVMA